MFTQLRFPILLSVLFGACGGAPGTKPHDMSTAGHEQAAQQHEKAAADFQKECARRPLPMPCWKGRDRTVVKEHRETAAKHRAASAALAAAEDRACVGVAPEDRDVSPFARKADIASVQPLVERGALGRSKTVGALVAFGPVPGLTVAGLQGIVDCHLARNAALGHVVPEMPDCPLVTRGVHARVRAVGDGFAVEIRSDDENTARDIRERAERLIRRPQAAHADRRDR